MSMGFSSQQYSSGLPFRSPGDLPDPETESASLALAGKFFYHYVTRGAHVIVGWALRGTRVTRVRTNVFKGVNMSTYF